MTEQTGRERSESAAAPVKSLQESLRGLSSQQRADIHEAACEIVAAASEDRPHRADEYLGDEVGKFAVEGIFVTLRRDGHLRGCCGTVGEPRSLLSALVQAGTRTATSDPRFPRVSPGELVRLQLDVSLLHTFEEIPVTGADRRQWIEPGRHGLKIIHEGRSGLLLPGVPVEFRWDVDTYLTQLCRKAGIADDAWMSPDSVLIRFESEMIGGAFQFPRPSRHFVHHVKKFVHENIECRFRGGIPACFPSTISDRTVDGVAIRVRHRRGEELIRGRIQIDGGLPLQMTLLGLTQTAGEWLRHVESLSARDASGGSANAARQTCEFQTDVLIVTDQQNLGTLADFECSDAVVSRRALVVTENERMGLIWNENAPVSCVDESQVDVWHHMVLAAGIENRSRARVYSFVPECSASEFQWVVRPEPETLPIMRDPAVAGRFYPADVGELWPVIRECLGSASTEKRMAGGIMVPHAGIRFSGHIAGKVWNSVILPSTVIIVAPKHTPFGAELAVSPCDVWQIPGTVLSSDTNLVRLLVEHIDGLECDAAAHEHEHAIEVELPFLAALAPETRVIGITIGVCSLDACLKFGRQLAEVIDRLEEAPLLVISSDMNHFADDDNTRRLDEMALAAMETLDPVVLYETAGRHQISMCGVLPAVIVMEALRSRQQLTHMTRCGYATSADVTGDRSRVVGYAGMILESR